MLLAILRSIRRIRRLRRRVFGGDAPHWAKDIYRVVKFVNLLELVPTLASIFLAPRHFFRRLDLTLNERRSGLKTVYKSPIGFATRSAVLIATTFQIPSITSLMAVAVGYFPPFLHSAARFELALGALFIMIPVLIPGVCLVLILLSFVMVIGGQTSIDASTQASLAGLVRFLSIPLSFDTYRSMYWKKFAWGAVYFFGYLITLPLITVAFIAFLLRVILRIDPSLVHFDEPLSTTLRIWAFIFLVLVAAVGRIVVYPYVALLLESRRGLSDLMWRFQVWRLQSALSLYETLCKKREKAEKKTVLSVIHRFASSDIRIAAAKKRINKEWDRFRYYLVGEIVRRHVPEESQIAEVERILEVVAVKIL